MGLPLGFLADRWSRRGIIVVGMTVWSVATSLCGLSANVAQFVLGRTLVGVGEASLAPASYSIIHDRFPRRVLARALGVFHVGSVIGSSMAFAVAGTAFKFFETKGAGISFGIPLQPWQKTFIVLGAPGLLYVVLLLFLKDAPKPADDEHSKAARRMEYAEVLSDWPRYFLIFFGMATISVVGYAFFSWVPAIISREFGWAPDRIGSQYGLVVLLGSPFGLFLGGWLCDTLVRRGQRNAHALVGLASAAMALVLSVGFTLATSAESLLAILGLMHFALVLATGVYPAYIQTITPNRVRSQASAAYILVLNLMGLGVGPAVIGWISSLNANDPHGLRAAVTLVVTTSLVISVTLHSILAWKERHRALPAADVQGLEASEALAS
jgi:MFS family permease